MLFCYKKFGYHDNGWDAKLVLRVSSSIPLERHSPGMCQFFSVFSLVLGKK